MQLSVLQSPRDSGVGFMSQRCAPGRQQSLAGPCLLLRRTDLARCLCTACKLQSDHQDATFLLRKSLGPDSPTGTVELTVCRGAVRSFQPRSIPHL